MRRVKLFAIGLCVYLVALFAAAGALVAFGPLDVPKPLPSITEPFARMDLTGLPPIERYRARDGAELSYRTYPGSGEQVAILIHGSAGSSNDMHPMARALQNVGVTVLVPDIRGHGANFPHGDVSYVGQLDDDLADFLKVVKPRYPAAKWTLLGFSSGGGFVLRVAGSSLGQAFDRFILLSPYLRYNAPTVRAASHNSSWYSVATARIIGLSIFGFFGIHNFDGRPVLAFPVPPNIESATSTYSFRMQKSFAPHRDYRADIRNVSRPMKVFVGGRDELFHPEEFAKVFGAERRDIPVTILPGLGHSDMIMKPLAIQAVVETFAPKGD